MNSIPSFLLAVSLLVATIVSQDVAGEETVRPFDGKSLDGWEFDAQHWRVEQGAIVGEIPRGQTLTKNTWMVWRGGELTDFDLRLQVKLTGAAAANSGIQFRCQAKDADHVSGYQADLDMGATWLGRIYDEHGRALLVERGQRVLLDPQGKRTAKTFAPAGMFATIFRENEWNDYRIVAIGERVAVFVNGTLFSELLDRDSKAQDLSGHLAFQLHSGPETRVEFRNIAITKLESEDKRLGAFALKPAEETAAKQLGTLPTDESGKDLNLDFETGDLNGWKISGKAFEGQPVDKDTIGERWRGQASNKQGRFFIGGYELSLSDTAQGTLTSPWFKVNKPFASFLIAGGRTPATRVDVIGRGKDSKEEVIATASGDQREQMRRVVVDLQAHQGREIAVRLVDTSSGGWGHLNFDDFRFHSTRPAYQESAGGPLHNPLLHHLRPAPNPAVVPGNTLAKMSVPPGFAVDLIAAEPRVHQPMAFTFDARGRLWVVEGHSYPTKRAAGKGLDKVLIFEDADHDGTFEKRKVFVEGLNLVSGMQVGHGGVWIGAAPELLFIPDRDQDDVPDSKPVVLLDGFGYGDTHETINSFIWGPDGWLYGNQGVFNESHVGKPGAEDDSRIKLSAGVWRYHPVRHQFEVFAHGGSNQWGLDFDDCGQLFMTHCRSAWGRGATTHVIQGAHFWTQLNNGYAAFVSNHPVAGIPEMKNFMLASARYGHGEGGAGKRGSRALYGGHSHVGTMIYLGDNWPRKYRNHLFTHNLHGHRINHQINQREGGGYNTVHAGYDVFHCADPQYIGVDLQCGPDGAVYISDWYDPRHCHSPLTEQWQRGNGRMYRLRYQGFQPASVNYAAAADLELVKAQLHANDWHVRMARLVLAERAGAGKIAPEAIAELQRMAVSHKVPSRRLRALWCLHGIGALDATIGERCLLDESEYVRAWMVQLLAESDQIQERDSLIVATLARERSPLVKLYLAAAAQRLKHQTSWLIVETLAEQEENAAERNLPALLWHTLAQILPTDTHRANRLVDSTKIPLIRYSLQWYLPQLSDEGREAITRRLAKARGTEQIETLRLMAAGLASARNLNQPRGWSTIAERLYQNDETRVPAEAIGAAFGDQVLYARMRRVLADDSDWRARRHALGILASDTNPDNLPILLKAIDDPKLRLIVLRQLSRYDDPVIADQLIRRLPQLAGSENEAAMETLCGRANSAIALLDAIKEKRIPKTQITGFFAQQLSNLGNTDVNQRLEKQWGKLNQSSAETKASIQRLVDAYKKAPLWAYNRNAGAGHFKKLCATCHVQSQNSERIGPKLAGTGSKGIEYIVENILDPNAVIGKDFQARTVFTVNGQVVTGVILKQTDTAVIIRTATKTQTIANDDIDEIAISPNSFMPKGLLKQLNDRERIELLMYLMSLR